MAESSKTALLGSTTFALQSCNSLYDRLFTFESRHSSVRDLLQVLEKLSGSLDSLEGAIHSSAYGKLSLLTLPLRQCGHICEGFDQQILTYSSRSDGDKKRFHSWSRLRYKDHDIESIKRLLTDYTSTTEVALLYTSL